MNSQSKIHDILTQLCKLNNSSLECVKQLEIESYTDFADKDIPVMVRILSDYSLDGKENAEDNICDILFDLAHSGVNWHDFVNRISSTTCPKIVVVSSAEIADRCKLLDKTV